MAESKQESEFLNSTSNNMLTEEFEEEETYVPLKYEKYAEKCQSDYKQIKEAGFFLNYESDIFVDLEPRPFHTVLFDHNFLKNADHFGPPTPHPQNLYVDKWNENFVRMPFSDSNVNQKGESQWKEIKRALDNMIEKLVIDPNSEHIEIAIKRINPKLSKQNFGNLHYFINEEIGGERGETMLKQLVVKIAKLAFSLPKKICSPIPILKQGTSHAVSMTQEQCACILANAFFCTFPHRFYKENSELLPYVNFDALYQRSRHETGSNCVVQKIKCLFHYFEQVTKQTSTATIRVVKYFILQVPEGVVTFQRNHILDQYLPKFRESTKPFSKVLVQLEGTIEDCSGAVQVDFANKYLGGGVLNHGCVQEEIRFVICPELMVSMLFNECMNPNESVVIRGAQRFSSYTGYGWSFKWDEEYTDQTPRDNFRRLYTEILAIDAIHFRYHKQQFGEAKVVRELRKAYAGFCLVEKTKQRAPVIATGNWGCGAFGGDRQLKFLIQMMAASEAERDLIYYTFNHKETVRTLNNLMLIIEKERLSVGDVYSLIMEYADEIRNESTSDLKGFGICKFLETKFLDKFLSLF